MIGTIRSHFQKHTQEVYSTIKLIDIEERFDLAFSRFFGLYLAKVGRYLNMTPTQVSLISLFIGVVGGLMLFYQESWVITVWASLLISLAGVLDSADGQLARMTGQSSEMGRFIDGSIDNLVFISCYLAGSAYYVQGEMGWSIFLIAVPAGLVSHSFASQIYDFYKSEFLYYVAGSQSSKVKTISELEEIPEGKGFWVKFFKKVEIDYTKKQWMLTSRNNEIRNLYETAAFNPSTRDKFVEAYRETFNPIMFWWALIGGSNTHRTLIMLFSVMGRFDLYLIVCLIKLIPLAIVMVAQKVMDEDFQKQLKFKLAVQ
jgi:phosphatidylglycerophosphate synthase